MTVTFESLGLSPKMLRALERAGYENPTPIQAQSIPSVLAGRNVIGCAATGTGKTAAFMLPLLERAAGKRGSRVLVLSPTRELAEQTAEYVKKFGPAHNIRAAVVVGGLGMNPQAEALRQRRAMIVATPGRLIDHMEQGNADLSTVETLVLDEADRMLDMGFRPQLERILSRLPARAQTLLFSATMAGEVGKFAKRYVDDPVEVEIHRSGTTAANAEQLLYRVERNEKPALLMALLAENDDTTLVFVRTKHRADRLAKTVERAGHSVARIHGNRSQAQRRHALEGFRGGKFRVLVATDVAARGIDVADIGHVINFDLPTEPQDYVHRVGRTARNEASGRATSFAESSDRGGVLAIERLIGTQIPRGAVPKTDPVFLAEMERRPPVAPEADGDREAGAPRAPRPPRAPRAPQQGRGSAGGGNQGQRAQGRGGAGGGRAPGRKGPGAGSAGRPGASGPGRSAKRRPQPARA
jgi:ATP-dependent RNA helicase RhlE